MTETIDAPAMTKQQVQAIAIELIDPCPVNPRKSFDETQLMELAVSVAKMGVTNPVTLRPVGEKRFELVCGHRRVEAAKRAGLKEVPAIVRRLGDADALDVALVDNLQRVDLSPMEEADSYAVLLKHMACSDVDNVIDAQEFASEIALKAGKTLRYVVQRLKLLSLIEEARGVMRLGLLGLDAALLVARLQPEDQGRALLYAIDHRRGAKGKTLQERIASAVANLQSEAAHWYRQSTLAELREWIAENIALSLKEAPWALDDAELLPQAGACTDCPKRANNNLALFGDLTAKEDACTDPACYGAKQKAFVKLTLKEAAASGAPVLKLSTSQSNLPIKEGSTLEKTLFKRGQWVEGKQGSCRDTYRGVTEDGEFKTVCVNQKCKVHRHEVQRPVDRGERVSPAEQERLQKEHQAKERFFEATETPIRQKIWAAVVAKLDAASALRLIADSLDGSAQLRKALAKMFPKADALALDARVLFSERFSRDVRPNTYWMTRDGGIANDRKALWNLARAAGVNADAIAAKHFHDEGLIAPAADPLYPKGVPWPKRVAEKRPSPAKPEAPAKSDVKATPARKAKKRAAKKAGRR